MTLRTFLVPTIVLVARPAAADITADDVWANTTAYFAATGGTMDATLERDGSTVFVNDVTLSYALPFGFGEFLATLPSMTMIEQSDGTVEQQLPKTFDVAMSFTSQPMFIDGLTFDMEVTQNDFNATATGDPGDITYTRSSGASTITAGFAFAEDGFEGLSMTFNFAAEGYGSTTRVTEGELITVEAETTVLPMTMEYSSDEGYGFRTEGSGEYGTTVSTSRFALPAGGTDITNLAPAFAAGLFLEGTTSTESASDRTATYIDDEIFSRDSSESGRSESSVSISADGLFTEGTVEDVSFTYEEQEFFNFSAGGDIAQLDVRFLIPLMAGEAPQDVGMAMTFDGVSLTDETWDLFDAGGALPRDAARIKLDLEGTVTSMVDLVNFAALEGAFDGPDLPVLLNSVTINEIDLDMAGATANGSGAFTFDNSDMATFGGMPRPEGEASVDISGANALLDALIEAGLVPESEAGMGRMMMGMFTEATGEDEARASVEVNAEGQVLVNGERIR